MDGKNVLLTLYMILSQKQVLPTSVGFKKLRRHKIDNPKIIQVLTGYKLGSSVQISKRPTLRNHHNSGLES